MGRWTKKHANRMGIKEHALGIKKKFFAFCCLIYHLGPTKCPFGNLLNVLSIEFQRIGDLWPKAERRLAKHHLKCWQGLQGSKQTLSIPRAERHQKKREKWRKTIDSLKRNAASAMATNSNKNLEILFSKLSLNRWKQ